MNFECSLCGYISDTKKSVVRHLSRKIKCKEGIPTILEIPIKINCCHCIKEFTTFPNLKKHLKTCKIKKTNLEEEVKSLKEKLLVAEALIKKATTSITNNNNTQININLAPWNNPLLPNDVEKYYRESVKKIFLAVPTLIKFIHFNTDHPENHNICIRNGRSKTAKVYNGKEWETIDEDQLIQTLIADYEQTLEDYSDTKNLSFTEKYQEIKDRDGEEKVYDDLHNEVKRVIYDRNHMIKIKN